MFVLSTIKDSVRVSPNMFALSTLQGVHIELDKKYPNRVIMDVGIVVCRYGDAFNIGDGICVTGDGGAHHDVTFRAIIFRPFVEEVCVGWISESSEEGIRVTMGFFQDIFVPAYWMLRPSHYDRDTGLWVWTPNYDDDEEGGDEEGGEKEEQQNEENQFEMELGSEIRFKVKAIHFTRVTNTAKGVQATTTTTASLPKSQVGMDRAVSGGSANASGTGDPVRKRSSSFELNDTKNLPASMQIIASICEDGLGLTSWWSTAEDEEEMEENQEENQEIGEDDYG